MRRLASVIFVWAWIAIAEADSVWIEAEDMDGSWKPGMAFGASGSARACDGTALTKTVQVKGGEYNVYLRAVSSPTQRATYRVTIAGQTLTTAAQPKAYRIGWIRAGRVRLSAGPALLRVEDGVKDGAEVLDAVALASDPLTDRAGQALAFDDYILREIERATQPLAPPRSVAEALSRQESIRKQLLVGMGLETLPSRTPLNSRITGRIDRGDYVIEKLAFESRPNYVVTALVYVPKQGAGRMPAVVGAIGHWNSGKSSLFPQLRAIGLVKRGYIVLNFDPSYAWERRIPGNSEGSDPYISGASISGHMAWDTMRSVDYLLSRTDVDPDRIGLTGASGGGQQTLYAGAVDSRFRAVAPAVYVWSFRDITAHWGYSQDNWIPGVLQNGDMAATLALIAPRPLLVLSVTKDYVPIEGTISQVEQARGFYRALAAQDKIQHSITPGEHGYNKPMREALYGFMDRWLKGSGDGSPQAEPELDPLPEDSKELLVFAGGKIPTDGAATVRSIWTDLAIRLKHELPASTAQLPAVLRNRILNFPQMTEPVGRAVPGGVMLRTEPGIETPAVLTGVGRSAVVWISSRDAAEEQRSDAVQELAKTSTVMVLEPRCMGSLADRQLNNQGAILLGRPLAGMWTLDVLQAVLYLRLRGFHSISVAGTGTYPGLVALLATVIEPRIQRARISGLFPSFLNVLGRDPIAEIPGILRYADIDQLVAATNGRAVLAP